MSATCPQSPQGAELDLEIIAVVAHARAYQNPGAYCRPAPMRIRVRLNLQHRRS